MEVIAAPARPSSRSGRLKQWWKVQPGVVQGLFIACALCILGGIYGWVRYGSAGLEFIGVTVGSTLFVLALCWIFDVAVRATERAVQRNRVVGAAGRLVWDAGTMVVWLLRAALWLVVAGFAIWLVVWAIRSMSVPVAIIAGALIIAGAISQARR